MRVVIVLVQGHGVMRSKLDANAVPLPNSDIGCSLYFSVIWRRTISLRGFCCYLLCRSPWMFQHAIDSLRQGWRHAVMCRKVDWRAVQPTTSRVDCTAGAVSRVFRYIKKKPKRMCLPSRSPVSIETSMNHFRSPRRQYNSGPDVLVPPKSNSLPTW